MSNDAYQILEIIQEGGSVDALVLTVRNGSPYCINQIPVYDFKATEGGSDNDG